mgnify:FL=1|jgi:IS30 family transposase
MGKLSKAKNLTNVEKFSIDGMEQNGMSVADIAKAIDRSIEKVSEYIDTRDVSIKARDLINNRTLSGKEGVAIMTEAASQKSDESKKEVATPETTGKSDYIHYG